MGFFNINAVAKHQKIEEGPLAEKKSHDAEKKLKGCHCPLPDCLAGADEWELGEAMVADRDSQNAITKYY